MDLTGRRDLLVDKDRSVVASHNADRLVHVQKVAVCSTVTSDRTTQRVGHCSIRCHHAGRFGTKQYLGGKDSGQLEDVAPWECVVIEDLPPFIQIFIFIVDLEGSTGEPDGRPVGMVGITEGVAIVRHDSTDRPTNRFRGFDRKGHDDAKCEKRNGNATRVRYRVQRSSEKFVLTDLLVGA
jgi:hypothetical protein